MSKLLYPITDFVESHKFRVCAAAAGLLCAVVPSAYWCTMHALHNYCAHTTVETSNIRAADVDALTHTAYHQPSSTRQKGKDTLQSFSCIGDGLGVTQTPCMSTRAHSARNYCKRCFPPSTAALALFSLTSADSPTELAQRLRNHVTSVVLATLYAWSDPT